MVLINMGCGDVPAPGPWINCDSYAGVNPDVLILVHGGPIAEPYDAEYVLARARHCHGFYGASSMERLPVERALSGQVARFKAIKRAQGKAKRPADRRSAGGRK